MKRANLFKAVPDRMTEEIFEPLIQTDHFKLERILSKGHAMPPGEWCDQEREEWVLLLKGSAGILFEGEKEVERMEPGDYIRIPGHRRHRVEWTDPNGETLWLALHYPGVRDKSGEAGL
jgi:cupin 2 domain-containing protein